MPVRVGTCPTGYVLGGARKLRGGSTRKSQVMEEIVDEAWKRIRQLQKEGR